MTIFRGPIAVGDNFKRSGTHVVVTKVVTTEVGNVLIWYRRADNATIAYPDVKETWEYEGAFVEASKPCDGNGK